MNRKERRASRKQTVSSAAAPSDLFAEAIALQRQHRHDEAMRAFRRLLALNPDHAQAHNELACLLQAQGQLREGSAHFARALTLMPQLFDDFKSVCGTLVSVVPALGEAMRRAAQAWPQAAPVAALFDDGIGAIADDPLLLCILQSTPVREFALERVLTLVRAALLDDTDKASSEPLLALCCALARQGFINEYVFAVGTDEDAKVERLAARIREISPMQIAALAMYRPLHGLPDAHLLLERQWPAPVDAVLTQQLREPMQERALREEIPHLTEIEDAVSQRVRAQYEENPYPRWVQVAGGVEPVALGDYLRGVFPNAPFAAPPADAGLQVLVAGSGTGWQAIGVAQKFKGARVRAVDLSLASLAYAQRKTPQQLRERIAYAQADILKLGALDRRFDLIECAGVLHHMADPFAGWRILLSLLKPGGLMHVGLYSALARRDIVAARGFIAERGYGSTPAEIRRCRQELIATPMRGVARFNDFFSTSECRDLLFHVQEARVDIPAIKDFIARHGLRFIGFEFDAGSMARYRAMFGERGWSLTDLDRWHGVESEYPDTFAGMYQIWLQAS